VARLIFVAIKSFDTLEIMTEDTVIALSIQGLGWILAGLGIAASFNPPTEEHQLLHFWRRPPVLIWARMVVVASCLYSFVFSFASFSRMNASIYQTNVTSTVSMYVPSLASLCLEDIRP
jgi:hypothetical protein